MWLARLSLTPTFKWVGDRAGSDPNRFSGFWLAFRNGARTFLPRFSHTSMQPRPGRAAEGAIAGDASEKPLKPGFCIGGFVGVHSGLVDRLNSGI